MQYSDSIDQSVQVLKQGNNSLYTNEWLLADTKTNEVAMFELGTHQSRLWRSSKNEWFGGTTGFYWGCNNAKDLQVRLETVPPPATSVPIGTVPMLDVVSPLAFMIAIPTPTAPAPSPTPIARAESSRFV